MPQTSFENECPNIIIPANTSFHCNCSLFIQYSAYNGYVLQFADAHYTSCELKYFLPKAKTLM